MRSGPPATFELPVLIAMPDAAHGLGVDADVPILAIAAQTLELLAGFVPGGFFPQFLEFHLILVERS
jgi:hypothetical protein